MRVSDSFRAFVLDQLGSIDDVIARPMFGGIGLYAQDLFFGIVASDVLYFKVDETSRPDYEAAGSAPFKPFADRPMTMAYYKVPTAVLEDAAGLSEWARRAIAVARSSPQKRSSPKKPKR